MAGASVHVTTATNDSSDVAVRVRFHSANDCLDYLGPAAYQPTPSAQGTIDSVGFNVPPNTLYVISGTILQVRWPNQSRQNTEKQ